MDLPSFISLVRSFTKFTDPDVQSDGLITSYVRLGEERISDDLRNADMVQIDTAQLTANRVKLPLDFKDMDFLKLRDSDTPIRFLSRDMFYAQGQPNGFFTTSGLFLMVGGTPDPAGVYVEMHYFGDVPQLIDAETWLSRRYPRLLLTATMAVASMGMVEDERAVLWETETTQRIGRLNNDYQQSIAAGSKLSRRQKGFG